MKIIKHPVFYIAAIIAIGIYLFQRFNLPLPNWVSFYVNDFLCLPLVLSVCLVVVRFFKKLENYYVSLAIVLCLAAYFSIYFEWILPQTNPRYTRDLVDVILYFLGALLFYKYQKRLF